MTLRAMFVLAWADGVAGARRAADGVGGHQPDRRARPMSRRRTVPPAAGRCASTSPGRTSSRGRSSTARRWTSSSARTRSRWTSLQKAGQIVAGSRVDLVSNQLAVVASAGSRGVRARALRAGAAGDSPARDWRSRSSAGRRLRAPVSRVRGPVDRRTNRGSCRRPTSARRSSPSRPAAPMRPSSTPPTLRPRRHATVAFLVPIDKGPRIVYPAAVLAASRTRRRRERFLAFPARARRCARSSRGTSSSALTQALVTAGMDVWQITALHGADRPGGDGADDPARPAARVAARATAFSRACPARDVRLAAARDAPGGDRADPAAAVLAARSAWPRARGSRHRRRVHVARRRDRDDGRWACRSSSARSRAGIEQVDRRYEAMASTLGAPPLRVFFSITLPLALPALAAGAVLGFARAIGEFGATIMIAGSIPGVDAHAAGGDLHVRGDRARSRSARCCSRLRRDRVRRAVALELPLRARGTAHVIALDFRLEQGTFMLEVHERLAAA